MTEKKGKSSMLLVQETYTPNHKYKKKKRILCRKGKTRYDGWLGRGCSNSF